jgi:hypothetical protein
MTDHAATIVSEIGWFGQFAKKPLVMSTRGFLLTIRSVGEIGYCKRAYIFSARSK